jgi:hypothetical protein
MIKAGYAESTASKQQARLTKHPEFLELADKYLPDTTLLRTHKETLKANKVISAQIFPDGKNGKPINDFIDVPDHPTRLKAVELGYKLKKKLNDDEGTGGLHFHAHINQQKEKYGL